MKRDIGELDRWIQEHPVFANACAVGIAVLIFELAMILEQLAIYVGRRL